VAWTLNDRVVENINLKISAPSYGHISGVLYVNYLAIRVMNADDALHHLRRWMANAGTRQLLTQDNMVLFWAGYELKLVEYALMIQR
jgi:hypothetical protein